MGALTPQDEILAAAATAKLFVTPEQLGEAKALIIDEDTHMSLGEILVHSGFITAKQLPVLEKFSSGTQVEFTLPTRDQLFGKIVVECGLASEEDLETALEEQKKVTAEGKSLRLGEALVRQGFLTLTQVEMLLRQQKKKILSCKSCGAQFNFYGYKSGMAATCTSCGTSLTTPEDLRKVGVRGDVSTSGRHKIVKEASPRVGRISNPNFGGGAVEDTKLDRFGNFEILDRISSGGMGVIYKARQIGLNRIVALKMLLVGRTASRRQLRFFYHEAEAVAKLNHPNIVLVYDVGSHEGEHFISMEYIRGSSLKEVLAEGKLDPEKGMAIARDVASALAYANLSGILHRDVKPGNIMIEKSTGRVLLTDFGLATIKTDQKSEQSKYAVGSPPYMAPEQADPHGKMGPIDTQSDLYSLGVVLYEMLTGLPPFTGSKALELIYQTIHETPPKIKEKNPDVPPKVAAICMKAMAKAKKDRYSSWEEFIYDIDCFLEKDSDLAKFEPEAADSGLSKREIFLLVVTTLAILTSIIVLVLQLK